LILTAGLLAAGCEEKPKYTKEQLAAMPLAKRDGLPEASGGFTLVVGDQTITTDEVVGPVFEKLAQPAQQQDLESFRRIAEPVIERLLVEKISNALLYSRAKNEAGENINDELDKAVTAEVRRFVTDFGGDYAKAEQALKQTGMDWGLFEQYKRRWILSQSYIAQQLPKEQPISYSEMMEAYNETKEKFYTTAGGLQIRLIDMEPAKLQNIDPNRPRLEQASQLASDILAKVKKGEDFERTVNDYPQEQRALSGGLWRKIDPESLAAPYDVLAERAKSMKPGEIAGPVEAQGHIFIMQLVEYRPQSVEPFEKVQNQVKARITAERMRRVLNKLDAELLQQASAADRKRFVDSCVREIYVMANK